MSTSVPGARVTRVYNAKRSTGTTARVWRKRHRALVDSFPRMLYIFQARWQACVAGRCTRITANRVRANHECRTWTIVPAAANAREIFKACVAHVHIEVSTYCNRVCGFCTNATYDRRTKTYMKDDLFFRILEDLKSIDYSHELCLWRYNEMLSDRDFIMERIRQCVAYLPNAKLWVTTNGDYLDRQYILDLIAAGVRRMWSIFICRKTPSTRCLQC